VDQYQEFGCLQFPREISEMVVQDAYMLCEYEVASFKDEDHGPRGGEGSKGIF